MPYKLSWKYKVRSRDTICYRLFTENFQYKFSVDLYFLVRLASVIKFDFLRGQLSFIVLKI